MDKILLIGAGGHARSCIDVLEEEKLFSISGEINALLENLLKTEKKINEDQAK